MKLDYQYIIVESFNVLDKSGRHGSVHIRPVPGQGLFKPNMFVECSKTLSTDYPIGTKFRIRAKITNREGGAAFIYSHYSWHYDVVPE